MVIHFLLGNVGHKVSMSEKGKDSKEVGGSKKNLKNKNQHY